jgi:hypothetical protein
VAQEKGRLFRGALQLLLVYETGRFRSLEFITEAQVPETTVKTPGARGGELLAGVVGEPSGCGVLRIVRRILVEEVLRARDDGVRPLSRSSMTRVNAKQPNTLYEGLFARLLGRCQHAAPGSSPDGTRSAWTSLLPRW